MADLIRFVDSVSASATTRLDLNDDTAVLHVREVQWSPPRLRRSVSQNMLRDGGHVGPSSYDLRTLVLSFDVIAADVDTLATHLQALTRELDRETNWLMYKPTGATHPVFFKTYRSDVTGFTEFPAAVAFRQLTVEVLTDPHALGLLETVSVGAVSNDPASAGGNYFDISSVKGDVDTPLMLVDGDGNDAQHILAVRRWGTPTDLTHFWQAEVTSTYWGADTTNPGGGPDAAMSGTSTNNYLRTSFATTATMATRLQARATTSPTTAQRRAFLGPFRVYAVVRRSAATSTIKVRGTVVLDTGASVTGSEVTIGTTTSRQIVDLGVFNFGVDRDSGPVGFGVSPYSGFDPYIDLAASRTGGTDTLDWDVVYLVPADDAVLIADITVSAASEDVLFDGEQERAYQSNAFASPTAYQAGFSQPVSGSFPRLTPGQTNRFVYIKTAHPAATGTVISRTTSISLTAYYYPRYTTIRPVAT